MLESSTAFIKATQIKKDESDSQSLTKETKQLRHVTLRLKITKFSCDREQQVIIRKKKNVLSWERWFGPSIWPIMLSVNYYIFTIQLVFVRFCCWLFLLKELLRVVGKDILP